MKELTGLVQKDIKACGAKGTNSPECKEYFSELQTCLSSCVSKVTDPAVQKELKSEISNFMAAQQGGSTGKPMPIQPDHPEI